MDNQETLIRYHFIQVDITISKRYTNAYEVFRKA